MRANTSSNKRAFFISFNKADRAWAAWIAWVLEEAGHSVWFQDWDFRGNFIEHMNRAHVQADRTLAVLSDHYFGSDFTLAEWSARFAQDPAAREDRLVPVKVGPLTDEGILAPILYADLTACDEAEAQRRLLERVKKALDVSYRPKPLIRPGFPGAAPREVPSKPGFPSPESIPKYISSATKEDRATPTSHLLDGCEKATVGFGKAKPTPWVMGGERRFLESCSTWGVPALVMMFAPWQNTLTHISLISDWFQPTLNIGASVLGPLICLVSYTALASRSREAAVRAALAWFVAFFVLLAICLTLKLTLGILFNPSPGVSVLLWLVWSLAYLLMFCGLGITMVAAGTAMKRTASAEPQQAGR